MLPQEDSESFLSDNWVPMSGDVWKPDSDEGIEPVKQLWRERTEFSEFIRIDSFVVAPKDLTALSDVFMVDGTDIRAYLPLQSKS